MKGKETMKRYPN